MNSLSHTDTYKNEENVTPENTQKVNFFEYLFVFMFILYTAKSNTFFASQSLRDGPVSYMIPVILSGLACFEMESYL